MNFLQPMMVAALLISGMGVALLGSVKVPLARMLGIDEARVGGLVSIFAFIMIPVILAAGHLTDSFGPQVVLVSGGILMACGLFLLAFARNYPVALGSVLLLGGGWSLLINAGNVLTPLAFRGGTTAYATNLANVFFGLGAFLTPLLVSALVRWRSLSTVLTLLGALTLIPGFLSLGIDFAALVPAAPTSTATAPVDSSLTTLLADPIVWLCGFALFFYGPLEASLAAWTTTYLGEKGIPERRASSFLSGFWLAYMLARLLTAFTLPADREEIFILILGLACVVVLLCLVLSRGPFLAMASVLAAGLIFGPIFPTIMAILLTHFPAALHGRAVGVLFAVGGIGWTVIPILIGAYARRTSIQRGFSVAVGAAVGLTAVALALLLNN